LARKPDSPRHGEGEKGDVDKETAGEERGNDTAKKEEF